MPGSTGNHSVTGLGITPVLVIQAMTRLTDWDSVAAGGNADSVGVGLFTASEEVSVSIQDKDGVPTSDTQSYQNTLAVHLASATFGGDSFGQGVLVQALNTTAKAVRMANLDDLDATVSSRSTITTEEVNTECDTALTDIKLNKLIAAAIVDTDVADNSALAKFVAKGATADYTSFDHTTDSLEAIRDRGDAAWGGGGGGGGATPADIAAVGSAFVRFRFGRAK